MLFDLINTLNFPFLQFQNIIWNEHIDKGASGDVYKCKFNSNECIGKCFYLKDYYNEKGLLYDVYSELSVYSKLNHLKCISEIVGYSYCENDEYICIIMKYYSSINLDNLIQNNNMNHKEKIDLMLKLSYGLKEIYDRGIIHCDIKPQNIIYSKDRCIYIDFGVSTHISENEIEESLGTEGYMSEELDSGYAYHKSDIYSLGVTFIELWMKDIWCKKKTYRKDVLFALKKIKSENIKLGNILSKCVSTDMNKRPKINTLIKHLENLT